MPKEVKKRTHAPSVIEYLTGKPPPAELEDALVVHRILTICTGDAISKTMRNAIMTATPKTSRVLKEVLNPLIEESQHLLHCVRCHLPFIHPSNHKEACVVKCDGDPLWNSEGEDEDDGFWEMRCCGNSYGEYDDTDLVCFKTSHTTDPKEVEYQEGNKEDKKAGLNLKGLNDVVTCRVNCCKAVRK